MFQSTAVTDRKEELSESIGSLQSASSINSDSQTPEWRLAYERKFSDLLFVLRATTEAVVIIHHPEVLGDDYEEIVESLNRLGDAGKKLMIVPRNERG